MSDHLPNGPLSQIRDLLYPAFWMAEIGDRFTFEISDEDSCVFAQSTSDPERKYAVAFPGDAVEVVSDRIKYLQKI